jgi:hypothetical protein
MGSQRKETFIGPDIEHRRFFIIFTRLPACTVFKLFILF